MSDLQELYEIQADVTNAIDRVHEVMSNTSDGKLKAILGEVLTNLTIATTSDHVYLSHAKSLDDAILLAKAAYDENKLNERDKLIKLFTPESESNYYPNIEDYFNPAGIAEIKALTLIPAVKLVRTITGYGLQESYAFAKQIRNE